METNRPARDFFLPLVVHFSQIFAEVEELDRLLDQYQYLNSKMKLKVLILDQIPLIYLHQFVCLLLSYNTHLSNFNILLLILEKNIKNQMLLCNTKLFVTHSRNSQNF